MFWIRREGCNNVVFAKDTGQGDKAITVHILHASLAVILLTGILGKINIIATLSLAKRIFRVLGFLGFRVLGF